MLSASVSARTRSSTKPSAIERETQPKAAKKNTHTHTQKTPKKQNKVQNQSAEFFSEKRELKENSNLLRLKLATEFWKNKFRDFVFSWPVFPGSFFFLITGRVQGSFCDFFLKKTLGGVPTVFFIFFQIFSCCSKSGDQWQEDLIGPSQKESWNYEGSPKQKIQ